MTSAHVAIGLALGAVTAAASLAGCLGQVDTSSTAMRLAARGPDAGAAPAQGASSPPTASVLLALGYPPDALTNDAEYVYWSELNSVFRASKLSPVRERLFGDGTSPASSIAVDDAFVYAVDVMRGSVRAWRKSADAMEIVVPEGSGARSLAQDDANLYVGTTEGGGGVRVISKASHEAVGTLRAGARVTQVAISGATVFTAEIQPDDRVHIVRSSTGGAGEDVVGASDSPPYQLVAAGEDAYWTEARGLVSTRSAAPLYAPSAGAFVASGLSVLDGNVYVTEMGRRADGGEGALVRVPLGGGAPSVVAKLTIDAPPNAFRAYGVRQTSDAASVYVSAYWTSDTGSARGDIIARVPVR